MSNTTLDRLRIDLKHWEACFEKYHKRKPTKDDIRQCGKEVQSMYKEYYKLKKLRDSVGDDLHHKIDENTVLKNKIENNNSLSALIKSSTSTRIITPTESKLFHDNITFKSNDSSLLHHSKLIEWHCAKNLLKDARKTDYTLISRDNIQSKHKCNGDGLNENIDPLENQEMLKILNESFSEYTAAKQIEHDSNDTSSEDSSYSNDVKHKSLLCYDKNETCPSIIPTNHSQENFVRINLKKKQYHKKSRFNHIHYGRQKRKHFWKRKKGSHFSDNYDIKFGNNDSRFGCSNFLNAVDPIQTNYDCLSLNNHIDDSLNNFRITYEQFYLDLKEQYCEIELESNIIAHINQNKKLNSISANFLSWSQDQLNYLLESELSKFGHLSFRTNQKETCLRILQGKTTLVVQQTGSGKSLCYQLPAMIYHKHFGSTALVVSPLISLMEDQVNSLPPCIRGISINHQMDESVRRLIHKNLSNGLYDVIFISPESLLNSTHILDQIPSISFVCIDEAHCLSKYSHNFRPAYLFICDLLKNEKNINCFLCVTATATYSTVNDIMSHLNGLPTTNPSNDNIQFDFNIPSNINFSVINTKNKNQELINIIEKHCSNIFNDSEYGNMIIYCNRRDTTEIIASLIRTTLGWNSLYTFKNDHTIEHYHAGLSKKTKTTILNRFLADKCKIIVATSAFGMGLNKKNVRVVIHYDFPSCYESFIQEVGRAGRDQLPAFSYIIADFNNLKDINEILKHIYSQSVDMLTLKKIVSNFFCSINVGLNHSCKDNQPHDKLGKVYSISLENVVKETNQYETTILTTFYIIKEFLKERIADKSTNIIGFNRPTRLILFVYEDFDSLLEECKKDVFLTSLLIHSTKIYNGHRHELHFNILSYLSKYSYCGLSYTLLLNILYKSLSQQQSLTYEFVENSVIVESSISLTNKLLDELIEYLFNHGKTYEKEQIYSRLSLIQLLYSLSNQKEDQDYNHMLRTCITHYFLSYNIDQFKTWFDKTTSSHYLMNILNDHIDSQTASNIMDSIVNLVDVYSDRKFNARTITNIFHGIDSPLFPRIVFSSDQRFWQKYLHIPYKKLFSIVQAFLLKNL